LFALLPLCSRQQTAAAWDDRQKEAKTQMYRQFEESDRQLATLREELANVRESQQRELEEAAIEKEKAAAEQAKLELETAKKASARRCIA